MTQENNCADVSAETRRVYIIDDDIDARRSLHFFLTSSRIAAWSFAGAVDFLDHVYDLAPGVVLLDLRMPEIDGLKALAILRERQIRWPVIIMTAHSDVPVAVRPIKLGAVEFLEKPFLPGSFDQALEQGFGALEDVILKERERDDARHLIGRLSAREHQVLTLLLEGISNKVAAHRLGLSGRTIEMHRGNALAKLRLRSIAEALALFLRADLSPSV